MRTVVICEKPSQAANLKAALGTAFGEILPAQGHLYTLAEPETYCEAWKVWAGFHVLRPERFKKVPTRDVDPARQAQLDRRRKAIADAVRGADRVIIATDCDREGQVIGTEILDTLDFKGERLRALFNSEDEASLKEAFAKLRPNRDYQHLYEAGLARERADQVYNLSLTRAATTALVPPGVKQVIGIGRVRSPTLGIVCLREMAIRDFKPQTSYGVAITVQAGAAQIILTWRPADEDQITDQAVAAKIAADMGGVTGALGVVTAKKTKAGPKPPDLATLQEIAGRWAWPASKVMEVAQALYDGHKVITYVRAETRYLPEVAKPTAAPIAAALHGLAPWSSVPAPALNLRGGKAGVFWDAGLKGESHHAIIPNVKTLDTLASTLAAFSADERRLYELIAGLFLQSVAPDYAYEETTLKLTLDGRDFTARATLPLAQGWRSYLAAADRAKDDDEIELASRLSDGQAVEVITATVTTKTTRPPERFNEGSLVMAMKNAAKYIRDPVLKARLEDAKGIGTQATRDSVITGLKDQGMIEVRAGKIYPTAAGNAVFATLVRTAHDMVDPGMTAIWEHRLDEITKGELTADAFVDEISAEVSRLLQLIKASPPSSAFGVAAPTKKMLDAVAAVQRATGHAPPRDYQTNFAACKTYLDVHPRQRAQANPSTKAN